jgi:hypothetical protein
MQRYCKKTIMEILWNNEKCKVAFENAGELIIKVANGNMHGDNVRTELFTKNLIEAIVTEQIGQASRRRGSK